MRFARVLKCSSAALRAGGTCLGLSASIPMTNNNLLHFFFFLRAAQHQSIRALEAHSRVDALKHFFWCFVLFFWFLVIYLRYHINIIMLR